jgi:hypothetical protein
VGNTFKEIGFGFIAVDIVSKKKNNSKSKSKDKNKDKN